MYLTTLKRLTNSVSHPLSIVTKFRQFSTSKIVKNMPKSSVYFHTSQYSAQEIFKNSRPFLDVPLRHPQVVQKIEEAKKAYRDVIMEEVSARQALNVRDIREKYRQMGEGSVTLQLNYKPGIALVLLNHPEKKNAISGKMMAELADAVDHLEIASNATHLLHHGQHKDCDDCNIFVKEGYADLCAVILAGVDGTFCSGFDLDVAKEIADHEGGREMSMLMHNTLSRLWRLHLVSVAAVDGYALGGAAELTVSTDHRVMAHGSLIRFVQVNMAVSPVFGGGARLARLLGRSRALQLITRTEKVTADKGLEWGLADYVGKPGQSAVDAAVEWLKPVIYFDPENKDEKVRQIRHSPRAIRATKAVIDAPDEANMDKDLAEERRFFMQLWGEDANLSAIFKKRRQA